jgi:hypothetical protein
VYDAQGKYGRKLNRRIGPFKTVDDAIRTTDEIMADEEERDNFLAGDDSEGSFGFNRDVVLGALPYDEPAV